MKNIYFYYDTHLCNSATRILCFLHSVKSSCFLNNNLMQTFQNLLKSVLMDWNWNRMNEILSLIYICLLKIFLPSPWINIFIVLKRILNIDKIYSFFCRVSGASPRVCSNRQTTITNSQRTIWSLQIRYNYLSWDTSARPWHRIRRLRENLVAFQGKILQSAWILIIEEMYSFEFTPDKRA